MGIGADYRWDSGGVRPAPLPPIFRKCRSRGCVGGRIHKEFKFIYYCYWCSQICENLLNRTQELNNG